MSALADRLTDRLGAWRAQRHDAGASELARRLLDCLRQGGGSANVPLVPLTPLNVAFAGHAGTWEWGDGARRLIVKYAPPGDSEAREGLRREAAVLGALAVSGVVAKLACVLREPAAAGAAVAGFAYERLPADCGTTFYQPVALAAFAEAIARLHACTWGLAYPPLGLDVPVAFGGHPLWIGGTAILDRMCAAIDHGESRQIARWGWEALELLEARRSAITRLFPSQSLVLIHGDIDESNILFRRETLACRCRLIDFGEAVVGAPQYDLARFAVCTRLAPALEELLLSLYALRIEEQTAGRAEALGASFRAGYLWQKALAQFDVGIASYVIYTAHGLNAGPLEIVLGRMRSALARLRAALTAAELATLLPADPAAPAPPLANPAALASPASAPGTQ